MSRAQEIRQNRLNERKAIAEKKTEQDMKIQDEANELFDWVLDMFENPTRDNTADEVHLSGSYEGRIRVGHDYRKGLTQKTFDWRVVKRLAEMFEAEDGYTAEFLEGRSYESYSSVTIKIE